MFKVKEAIKKINERGIPLPLFRDCRSDKPSITYTLVVASAFFCVLGLITVENSLVSIDFDNSFNLLIASAGMYLGRKYQKKGEEQTLEKE